MVVQALGPAAWSDNSEARIETEPPLFPRFDPAVSDYTVRCTDGVTVRGEAPPGRPVTVDGHGPLTGSFEERVALSANQAFTFATSSVVNSGGGSGGRQHHVRCLPGNFPTWAFDRLGEPAHDLYFVAPTLRQAAGGRYAVMFDRNGVPVWWLATSSVTGLALTDAKVLSDGTIALARTDETGYEIREPDGGLIRVVAFVGAPTDPHDMQEAGNGNLLVMSYKPRATTEDLTAIGGPSDAMVRDAAIQEIDPDGDVVWEWNSKDHIGLDEIAQAWWGNAVDNSPYDIVHLNSIQPAGDSIVISLRFTDAIYGISRTTGEVEWKLGGTTIPESLTVVGDPYGAYPLSGQHDARILGDGTLTVHDNANNVGHPPRGVRYAIDEVGRTATLLESVEDPEVSTAGCCGGARRSDSGSWLFSWGQRSQVTEFGPGLDRTFRLRFGPLGTGPFSYRAFPVPDDLLTVGALRLGMSEMFPR